MISKNLIKLFSLFLIFSASQLHGQTSLSLIEAQEYALKNSAQVKNALLDIEKAKKKIWETAAMGLPQINGAVEYTYMPTIPEMQFSAVTHGELQPDGKTVLLNSIDVPIKLGVPHSVTFSATASQLVFSGSYIVGLQTSKMFKKLSEQSLQMSENDVKEDVANTYYMVLAADENNKLLKSTSENMKKTLMEFEAMFKEGLIESTDVDQLKYTVTNIDNTSKMLERQVAIAYRLLKFQMGMDLSQEIILSDQLDDVIAGITMESIINKNLDINSNITYQLLNTQESLQEALVRLEKSAYLPTLAAFYQHQEKPFKADFDFSFPDIAGASLSIPIFSSGMRNAKVAQANIELEKSRNTKKMAVQGLMLEAQQSHIMLQSSFEKFINEKSNQELAKSIYNKTLIKYKEGMSSSMDLTVANSQYLSAQSNYFNALLEVLQAKNKLDNILNNK
ncbi:MAG: TolC family protein [Bacteroidetes bacterium]|jgi:outer membrane protein|nr:TolC family protein [Bacteroidota bacterium]MBT5531209.1 TolC family protein [Cytophagia bacterium]MBT3423242.1 TolC family protein [Bacteroidota bacterium]MBT3800213.1 TolC family protein [Bacteroidota bacterium]MBT4337194.1 TolC family protein [Bacteroidota bacterium]